MGLTFALDLMVLLIWNQNVYLWWISNKYLYDVIWFKVTLAIDRGWFGCGVPFRVFLCYVL
jgi:hypothetical protein